MKNVLVILASAVICFLSGCSNVKDVPSIAVIEKDFVRFLIVSGWDVIGIGFRIISPRKE